MDQAPGHAGEHENADQQQAPQGELAVARGLFRQFGCRFTRGGALRPLYFTEGCLFEPFKFIDAEAGRNLGKRLTARHRVGAAEIQSVRRRATREKDERVGLPG